MLNGSPVLQCRARLIARLALQHPSHFARPISQPFARHSSLVCLFWGEEVHGDCLQTGDGRPTNSFVTKRLMGPENKKPALNPPRKHLYSPGRRIWRLRSGEAHPRICPFPPLLLFFPWPKNPRPGACSSFQDRFCVHRALCSSVAERTSRGKDEGVESPHPRWFCFEWARLGFYHVAYLDVTLVKIIFCGKSRPNTCRRNVRAGAEEELT